MNITQSLDYNQQHFPHQVALVFEGQSFTYQQLNQMVNRLANGLRGNGIESGDRVALLLPNIPAFAIAYFSILKLGAIAVSLNVMLTGGEIQTILNDCSPKLLITTGELIGNVPDHVLPEPEQVVIAEGQSLRGIPLEQVIVDAASEFSALDVSNDQAAAIIYTSGTTGIPKGVTLSHGNVIFNSTAANRCYGTQPDDRLLLYLPLFHCFGQNAILNSGIQAGATIVLQRRFHPEGVLSAIADHGITMFFGVPTVYIKLLDLLGKNSANYDLSSIRYYFTAAASMPTEIVELWRRLHGAQIYEGYGLSETSPFLSYNHISKYKPGSVGTPIANVEVKIVDLAGFEVKPGELGEILVKGPNLMLGYWNRPIATAKTIKQGWLHTGDIGCIDHEGYLYVVDRLKDMINVSGFKVYPAEVENVLYQHPAIAEVAVYRFPDAIKGEVVAASIIPKLGQRVTAEEITHFSETRMAKYKIPKVIQITDFIPKNAVGKVLKRMLS
ncbi:long-chain fatty acid--CoA ligase [Moorena sp. SIO4G3]|uniref:class I adenylate-forming enzyme family protein n=1 Tax=Moorena sp. SIO4G3 TaxID=2607821 RepID=UPI001429EB08|nr:long-chain fatty acid--CoA ligase [Moorena sp. SIO4G3]NEO80018.1 long-chain fatty acid--CoA ligase [Moorena sp. SIO4G3]